MKEKFTIQLTAQNDAYGINRYWTPRLEGEQCDRLFEACKAKGDTFVYDDGCFGWNSFDMPEYYEDLFNIVILLPDDSVELTCPYDGFIMALLQLHLWTNEAFLEEGKRGGAQDHWDCTLDFLHNTVLRMKSHDEALA